MVSGLGRGILGTGILGIGIAGTGGGPVQVSQTSPQGLRYEAAEGVLVHVPQG